MSDRFCAMITIGGQLARFHVPKLAQAITESGVVNQWGTARLDPKDAEDLLSILQDDRLFLCDDEARYGEFPEIEEVCRELGLSYRRHSEAKYQYDAVIEDWRLGMSEPLVRKGSNDHTNSVYVSEDVIKPALKCLEAGDTEKTLSILRGLCPEIPEIPPFEIV